MNRFLPLGFLAAILALAGVSQAGATFPGTPGLVAVAERSTGNSEIVTMFLDPATSVVSHERRLTSDPADDYDPAFSADGTRIAFVSERDGNPEIYVMDADGSNQTRVTDHAGDDLDPAFSPDGTRLAIRRNIDGDNQIVLIDSADGGNPVVLTTDAASDFNPEFSPDGTKIVFQRFTSGNGIGFGNEVMLMNSDGTDQTNLTENENTINDGEPSFSPDGTKIAFHSNRGPGFRVHVMDLADGTVEPAADSGIFPTQEPAWSPDGERIAVRVGSTNTNLAILQPTESSFLQVTPGGDQVTPNWQSDDIAPVTVIDAGPDDSEAISADPTFEFSADEPGSTFECSTDGAGFVPCASPQALSGLADGSHTFSVRATDLPGNVSGPVSRNFSVDTTGPVIEFTSTPAPISGSDTAEFAFSANEPLLGAECNWDGEGWEPCSSPATRESLAEGTHNLEVRGTDLLGNAGQSVSAGWVVETIPPTVTITAGPDNPTAEPNAWFQFASPTETADFECRLDPDGETAWTPCVSGVGYEDLTDGTHLFQVRAVGQGAGPGTPVETGWTIDTVAPRLGLTAAPVSPTNRTMAEFGFAMNKPGFTFLCHLDATPAEPCSSPLSIPELAAGDHSLLIQALDAGGQVIDSVHHGWRILAEPPVSTILSGPDSYVSSRSSTLRFRADLPEAVFECSIDEGAWGTCTSPASVTSAADGPVRFEVRAKLPGESAGPETSHEWTVDTIAPTVSASGGPVARVSATAASFDVSVDDPAATTSCRIDEGSWQSCSGDFIVTGLADGAHVLRVMATDAAGNTGWARRDWSVDTTGPVVTFNSAPATETNGRSARFTFAASEVGSTFECRLDSAEWAACVSPHQLNFVDLGSRRFEVRATDDLGNQGQATLHEWHVAAPRFKGLKPKFKLFKRVRLDREGVGRIAVIGCPEGRCRVIAPHRLSFRKRGRKFTPGIRAPRGFYRERRSEIMITLSPGARKVLRRHGPARVKLRLTVQANNGTRVTRNLRVTLTGR